MNQVYYTSKGKPIQIGNRLGSGGEGAVYLIQSTSQNYHDLCVKLYSTNDRQELKEKEAKITYMVDNPPSNLGDSSFKICWPEALLYKRKNCQDFVGFIMQRAFTDSKELFYFTKLKLKKLQGKWNKFDRNAKDAFIIRKKLCVNLAWAVDQIHAVKHYVMVDMKPENILITDTGKVSLIDIDSIQISRGVKVIQPGRVATPEYSPPEKLDPKNDHIPESWDRFSLAVIFYLVLFGIHPYSATFPPKCGPSNTFTESIRSGLFVFGSQSVHITVLPNGHQNFRALSKEIQSLFIRCFESGNYDPDSRPSAKEWGIKLAQQIQQNPHSSIKPISSLSPQQRSKKNTVTSPTKRKVAQRPFQPLPQNKKPSSPTQSVTSFPLLDQLKKPTILIPVLLVVAVGLFFLLRHSNSEQPIPPPETKPRISIKNPGGGGEDATSPLTPPPAPTVDYQKQLLEQKLSQNLMNLSDRSSSPVARSKLIPSVVQQLFSNSSVVKVIGDGGTVVKTATAEEYLSDLVASMTIKSVEIRAVIKGRDDKIQEVTLKEYYQL